jgi:hypothetical protein
VTEDIMVFIIIIHEDQDFISEEPGDEKTSVFSVEDTYNKKIIDQMSIVKKESF